VSPSLRNFDNKTFYICKEYHNLLIQWHVTFSHFHPTLIFQCLRGISLVHYIYRCISYKSKKFCSAAPWGETIWYANFQTVSFNQHLGRVKDGNSWHSFFQLKSYKEFYTCNLVGKLTNTVSAILFKSLPRWGVNPESFNLFHLTLPLSYSGWPHTSNT